MEYLVVSFHESSSLFILFSNLFFNIKIPFLFHVIFISYFFYFFFSFLLFLKPSSKPFSFIFMSPFYRLLHRSLSDFFSHPFTYSFNKKEIVNIIREWTINASIASCPHGFDPLSQCDNGSIEGTLAHTFLHFITYVFKCLVPPDQTLG